MSSTIGSGDYSLTADGILFQTIGAKMQKARAAVADLVGGTISSVEFVE